MYVYLIQSGNKPKSPIKIGMSDNPEKRIKQLQTGNPVQLRLVLSIKCKSRAGAFKLESDMHNLLHKMNIINEWYSVVRSNVYKALNELANNNKHGKIVNGVGLFSEMSEEDKINQKAEKRLYQLIDFGKKEANLIRKLKEKDKEIECLIAKSSKRKADNIILIDRLKSIDHTIGIDKP